MSFPPVSTKIQITQYRQEGTIKLAIWYQTFLYPFHITSRQESKILRPVRKLNLDQMSRFARKEFLSHQSQFSDPWPAGQPWLCTPISHYTHDKSTTTYVPTYIRTIVYSFLHLHVFLVLVSIILYLWSLCCMYLIEFCIPGSYQSLSVVNRKPVFF